MGTLVAGSALIRSWFNSHIHMQHSEGRKDMLSYRVVGSDARPCSSVSSNSMTLNSTRTLRVI